MHRALPPTTDTRSGGSTGGQPTQRGLHHRRLQRGDVRIGEVRIDDVDDARGDLLTQALLPLIRQTAKERGEASIVYTSSLG